MGHYDEQYEAEEDKIIIERKQRDNKLIAEGYERVPEALQKFFNQVWIHKDELKVLRRWLNSCPYCKLTDSDN